MTMGRVSDLLMAVGVGSLLAGCGNTQYTTAVPEDVIREMREEVGAPLWREPLGTAAIVDMELVGDDYLLVRQRPDAGRPDGVHTSLIHRSTGETFWEYHPPSRAASLSRVAVTGESVVFKVANDDSASLVAVGIDDGTTRWQSSVATTSLVQPAPQEDMLVITESTNERINVLGMNLANGETAWRLSYARAENPLPPAPLVRAGVCYHFYDGVTAVSPASGKRLWQRNLVAGSETVPVVRSDRLMFLDPEHRLNVLDTQTGRTRWRQRQDPSIRYSNIAPVDGDLYLRGEARDDGLRNVLDAVDSSNGERRWRFTYAVPTVSNIIHHDGHVFVATATELFALDAGTGKVTFQKTVTNTLGKFPTRLRRIDDDIIFIGEMIVAAYDAISGEQRFVRGMNPVSDAILLSGLEDEIDYFAGGLAATNTTTSFWSSVAGSAASEASRAQNMANHYNELADNEYFEARATGDTSDLLEANQARLRANIESEYAQAQRQVAIHAGMMQLSNVLSQMLASTEARRRGQVALLRQQALLNVYGNAESGRYVYRPSAYGRRRTSPFVGITIVDLQSGDTAQSVLSSRYQSFGLWTLVDWQRGVAYTQGIGLDPDQYEMGSAQFFDERYETFLIARPVELP